MTRVRKINVSQVEGKGANNTDSSEIRPFGETGFYLDTDQNPDALTLMMFDGVRTHLRSKVLRPGILYGSNENSSDGLGYDTIKLIPDSLLDYNSEYTNDQYIIIEPTIGEPGHVHIRSGGTMDQSTADLFLGGELNHVKVSDTNDTVIISTDAGGEGATNEWAFNSAGYLQFPGGSNGRIGEDEPGLVVYSDLNFGILTNLANTENSRAWIFTNEGDLTLPDGGDVVNSTGVSQTAQRVEGSWTLPDDTTDTYSFTLPSDGTYIMWVKGNIPNGIITWNATASVTNTNVPAIGSQYAWNYTGGGSPILLTALPNQIRGVAGTISTDATYAGTTSNRFDFEISNTSGSTQTVYYGYTKI
jgi:hypothetical protein